MSNDDWQLWLIIITSGIGTFLLRFSFLGAVGQRRLPPLVLRLLRYTAAGVFPALAVPLVVWPAATAGQIDPPRLAAAVVTLVLGVATRNLLVSILGGGITLYALLALVG